MTCCSFVGRGDPEEHRFAKWHGEKIDADGKLCRYRADHARTAGSIRIANPIEDQFGESGRDGDRGKPYLPEQCPGLMRAAVHVRLHRRLDQSSRQIAGRIRYGVTRPSSLST